MRIYGYARISRDEDKKNYDSIVMQKMIIQQQAAKLNHPVIEIFEDDNVSGYTFERPGLSALKRKIENGEVDVLIAKDLSRIGRHNARTLLFLEYLEEHHVRLILPMKRYDSFEDKDDMLGIETWLNERYVKETSQKIRDAIRMKQKTNGLVVKNIFGYEKDRHNKHRLIIDENAAYIVRKIFELYIGGKGYRKIAEQLNREKILTPSQYMQAKFGGNFRVAEKWNAVHVARIIANDVYTGVLRCRKTEKQKIKGKSVLVDSSRQFVHENHHPAIISKKDFELAQMIAQKRRERKIRAGRKGMNLYSGYLFCGDCKSYMIAKKRANGTVGYYCGTYHQHGSSACSTHYITEQKITDILFENLKYMMRCPQIDWTEIDKSISTHFTSKQRYDLFSYRKLKEEIDAKRKEVKNYLRRQIQDQEKFEFFQELACEAQRELELLMQRLGEMEQYQKLKKKYKQMEVKGLDELERLIAEKDLTREDIEILLDKIYIHQLGPAKRGIAPQLSLHVIWNAWGYTM